MSRARESVIEAYRSQGTKFFSVSTGNEPKVAEGPLLGNSKTTLGCTSSPMQSDRDLSLVAGVPPHKVVNLVCHQSLLHIGFSISIIRGLGS